MFSYLCMKDNSPKLCDHIQLTAQVKDFPYECDVVFRCLTQLYILTVCDSLALCLLLSQSGIE